MVYKRTRTPNPVYLKKHTPKLRCWNIKENTCTCITKWTDTTISYHIHFKEAVVVNHSESENDLQTSSYQFVLENKNEWLLTFLLLFFFFFFFGGGALGATTVKHNDKSVLSINM